MKIAFVLNTFKFFYSHRIEIGKKLLSEGHEVHIIASGEQKKNLQKHGFHVHEYKNSKPTINPIKEIICIHSIFKILRSVNPDLLHLITLKPYIYGGLINRFYLKKSIVISVAGLGLLVSNESKSMLLKSVIIFLMKMSFKNSYLKVITQNDQDTDFLVANKICLIEKIKLIRGSGVNLNKYQPIKENSDNFICTFASRLLIDKGVKEFIHAANKLIHYDIKFWVVGEPDDNNPKSVSIEELRLISKNPNIEFFGYRQDMEKIFQLSNIVVYPSYYGEGIPKVLIEASACGRPIITTDHPGCRDAILNNITGLLCKVRDIDSIVDAILKLFKDDKLRVSFGNEARAFAEKNFNVLDVVDEHFNIYKQLINND